jgi:hypothetical protein
MPVLDIVVLVSLVNCLSVVSVVTSCCVVEGSSVVVTSEPINMKAILIKVQL